MIINFLLFVVVGISLLIASFVYFSNRKSFTNIAFSIVVAIGSLWALSIVMFRMSNTFESVLLWDKLIYIAGVLLPSSFLFFAQVAPEEEIEIPTLYKIAYLLPIAIFIPILLFTKFWIQEITVAPQGNTVTLGPAYNIWMIWFMVYMGWTFFTFLAKYSRVEGRRKAQLQYIILAFIFPAIASPPFNIILPLFGNYQLIWIGPLSLIFTFFITGYAIVAQELFGIRVILTELLVGTLAVVLLVQALIAESLSLRILNGAIFILFCVFGYRLTKGLLREIEYREELEETSAELEKINKTKTEFLAMASHQLRTPLAIIKGYAASLIEETYGELTQKMKEPLRRIFSSNKRLENIVETLLNVSRIEMDEIPTDFKKTQIEDLIDQIYQQMKIKADQKKLNFIWNRPETPLPKADIDSEKISEVITNLVDNAIRYTHQGKVEIRVKQINADTIQIIVEDTGEGLTEEDKVKMFTAFTRGEAGTDYWIQGAGLGLFLAKKYVKLHYGKLWAESEGKGKGSTFYLELPIERQGAGNE